MQTDEPAVVVIKDPADVYPTQVERLTQDEYNARLRTAVEDHCDGCTGYKPLSPKVQSLNCHFESISLNGVCSFRCEQKPSPRSFGQNLQWLGGSVIRYKYAQRDAEELRQEIRTHTCIIFDSVIKTEGPDGSCLLTVTPKKKELLTPCLTLAMEHYLDKVTQGSFRLVPAVRPDTSPEALLGLTTPERLEAFRKECKKYGVSLAEMTWDGQDEGRVMDMLWEQNKHSLLYPLCAAPGRAILLLMDTAEALKALRFYTPMLEAHGAAITIHGQYHSRRYTVNFDMPFETLD